MYLKSDLGRKFEMQFVPHFLWHQKIATWINFFLLTGLTLMQFGLQVQTLIRDLLWICTKL